MKLCIKLLSTAVFLALTHPKPAQTHPIDCAIAICLPGGFPSSRECTGAKIEVIRRITPDPFVQPPLQIWRCPLNTGASIPGVGADGTTPEMMAWRSGIEVWELWKRTSNSSGGREMQFRATRHSYNEAGDFVRGPVQLADVPAWVGGAVHQHTGFPLASEYGSGFRAILFRYGDYDGGSTAEWFAY